MHSHSKLLLCQLIENNLEDIYSRQNRYNYRITIIAYPKSSRTRKYEMLDKPHLK